MYLWVPVQYRLPSTVAGGLETGVEATKFDKWTEMPAARPIAGASVATLRTAAAKPPSDQKRDGGWLSVRREHWGGRIGGIAGAGAGCSSRSGR